MNKIKKLVLEVLNKSYGKPFPLLDYKIVGKFGMKGWEGCPAYSVEQWVYDFLTWNKEVTLFSDIFSVNIRITTEATTKYPDYHINEFLPGVTHMRESEIQSTFGHLVAEDSQADGFWKCPTVDSRNFPSYVQADDDDKTTCENCDQEVDKGDTKLFNGHEFCNRCFEDFTPNREELEEQHGQVWNTKELQQDFTVQGFASPCVVVIRKSDGVKGTLEFIHQPRFYFDFVEAG